jgi:hypothetical protein
MGFFRRVDDSAFGKAARNERRKIRANFMNGLAVSALAIGYLAPAASLFSRLGAAGPSLPSSPWYYPLTFGEAVCGVIFLLVSMFAANEFHSIALKEAGRIED